MNKKTRILQVWPKSRKGFLATYIVDFYAYLVFVAIVIIFFFVLAFMPPPAEGEKITTTKHNYDATIMLIHFLQQPTMIQDKQTTPLEIIQNTNPAEVRNAEDIINPALEKYYLNKDKKAPKIAIYPSSRQPTEYICKAHNNAFGFILLPRKELADFFTVTFCIPMEHFK